MVWMVERCFAERDACGWIIGVGDRDPDEVIGSDVGVCELSAAGTDCEADSGAAVVNFRGGEL